MPMDLQNIDNRCLDYSCVECELGIRSGTVGWSTVLQARRLWVPFPTGSSAFFIMATKAQGSTQSLTEMSFGVISWE